MLISRVFSGPSTIDIGLVAKVELNLNSFWGSSRLILSSYRSRKTKWIFLDWFPVNNFEIYWTNVVKFYICFCGMHLLCFDVTSILLKSVIVSEGRFKKPYSCFVHALSSRTSNHSTLHYAMVYLISLCMFTF
jgi:hypothetical protein